MKKAILPIIMASLLTSCAEIADELKSSVTPPPFTDKDFVGTWHCQTSMSPKWEGATDTYVYTRDHQGNANTTANLNLSLVTSVPGYSGEKVGYTVKSKSQNRVEGWYSYTTFKAGETQYIPNYSAETKTKMRKDPQFKKVLDIFQQFLNSESQKNQIQKFKIMDYTGTGYTSRSAMGYTAYHYCERSK